METQRATVGAAGATIGATELQPGTLKALADAVLARNKARNGTATEREKSRNLMPDQQDRELHLPRTHCTVLKPPIDPAAEARRQCVLAMLADQPGVRYAVLMDTEADHEAVILALAIRRALPDGGTVTCELTIPRAKYDPFLLLQLIERHGGTVH
jgi:hypothetical protein